ncbi:MAG: hypothetical protein KBD83_06590 [Gammaproteobacteria bacterium]|nr:hypothetical protein [Gammaproteobacteria bacterium]
MMINRLETKEQYTQCLHNALKHLGDQLGQVELHTPMEDLAVDCGVPLECFKAHFPSMNDLLQNIIHQMHTLFERNVQNQLVTCTFMKKKKVTYFLRCIRLFLLETPEAGFLFTLGFFGDVVVDPIYRQLEQYYDLWEDTIYECFTAVFDEPFAKSMTKQYLSLLKGRCHRTDLEGIGYALRDAENFVSILLKYY